MPKPHKRRLDFQSGDEVIAGLGAVIFVAGLIWLNLTATLNGLSLTMLGKLWFIDRMVWIQRENEIS